MEQRKARDSLSKASLFRVFKESADADPEFNYEKKAKKITAIYLAFGFTWILASDRIMDIFIRDRELIFQISILKGWIYVFLTGALIYFLMFFAFRKISKASNELAAESNERKRREQQILYLNGHDILTGLYNRSFFEQELKKYGSGGNIPVSLILWDINGLKIVNDVFGRAKGDEMLMLFASEINRVFAGQGIVARWGGDEFAVLLPGMPNKAAGGMCKEVLDHLDAINRESQLPASITFGISTKTVEEDSMNSMLKNAEDMLFRSKLTQVDSSRYYVIESIRRSLYEKDIETEEHAERLRVLSEKIGSHFGLTRSEEKELEIFAMLHDIGKIAISDSILNKPGKLDDHEWEKMKRHSEIGYRIARSVPELANVAEYILAHHERWDGTGYPKGLTGESIPLLARIVAVTDAFDAMTSDRPYRKAMKLEDAVMELKNCAGSHFDPSIVSIFIDRVIFKENETIDIYDIAGGSVKSREPLFKGDPDLLN